MVIHEEFKIFIATIAQAKTDRLQKAGGHFRGPDLFSMSEKTHQIMDTVVSIFGGCKVRWFDTS